MRIEAMLCDHAQVLEGKLIIVGGGINRMTFPQAAPAPYAVSFSAAGLVRVPWDALGVEHELSFHILTEDGENPLLPAGPEGPERVPVTGSLVFKALKEAALAGTSASVPFVFALQSLHLMGLGRYLLSLRVDGEEASSLAFTVLTAS